jgi:signal transduction histidine kinase/CheY-like chemotaxis protein
MNTTVSFVPETSIHSGDENHFNQFVERIFTITKQIENGDEPKKILTSICEEIDKIPGVEATALFLPSEKNVSLKNFNELFFSSENCIVNWESIYENNDLASRSMVALDANDRYFTDELNHNYFFDLITLGASAGTLCVFAPQGLHEKNILQIEFLCHYASSVYEKFKLSNTVQHLLDRLQVLNDLNQLIGSYAALPKIVKNIARESAFRFGADIALTLLVDEKGEFLECKGGYGCTPDMIPKQISLETGMLSQIIKTGGHFSIYNLNKRETEGLDFLKKIGVKSVEACTIEVLEEMIGIIIIGYKREYVITKNDLSRFEEFCKGSGVAIANAKTRERITAYTERLEEIVAQRTADLAYQTARAEQATQAKSEFLANMSHELRTPLTAIVGYASVLLDGIFGPMNDRQVDAVTAVVKSSDHLKNLIDDVLNLARVESGKENPEPVNVNIGELLTHSHKLVMQTAVNKGINLLSVNLPNDVAIRNAYVDRKHIQQIIINLLSNAIKYTPRGGKAWISAVTEGERIKISVSDTGVGIPQHKLEKLFERFERGEDSYSKNQEGTGIGLNLTKRLTELNNGQIGVESKQGEGSTFWISLPLSSEVVEEETIVKEAFDTSKLTGLKTLVIDDNPDTREILKIILSKSGASVLTAASAKEAREIIQSSSLDIILTDLAMPGESGISVINYVKNSEQYSKIPILVLSACAFEKDRENALNAGASQFIPKPFNSQDVLKAVKQHSRVAVESSKVKLIK